MRDVTDIVAGRRDEAIRKSTDSAACGHPENSGYALITGENMTQLPADPVADPTAP
jgi:hypothetical protein